jgi:hypothetical protein
MNASFQVAIVVLALCAIAPQQPTATAQNQSAPYTCVVTVPSGWGDFKGAVSEYGLVFQDSAGTLRFIQNPACQVAGTQPLPIVSLEVRRK